MFHTKLEELLAATGVVKEDPETSTKPTGKTEVYFASSDEIKVISAEIDKQIGFRGGAVNWKWWNGRSIVTRAVILVSTDVFEGEELEDITLELLLHVFGLPSKSKRVDNSCVSFESDPMTSLQPLDIAVLKFLYESVPAGTEPSDLKKLIRSEWDPAK